MSELVLAQPLGGRRWRWWPAGGGSRPSDGEAAALARFTRGRRVCVLVPAEQVLLTEVQVSARRRREVLQAVPYALEDQLLEEVEATRFGIGEREPEGRVAVAAMNRARLEAMVEPLRLARVRVQAVLPDCLALPRAAEGWTLLAEGGRLVARTGPLAGLALETDAALAALAELLARTPRPPRVRLLAAPGVDGAALAARLGRAGLGEVAVEQLANAAAAYGAPESTALALDLCPPAAEAPGAGRLWMASAALLLAALGLHAGLLAWRALAAERELAAVRAESEALFRESFPEVGRLVDLRVQAAREVERMRARAAAEEPALGLLLAAAQARAARPQVSVAAVDYVEGALTLELGAPGAADFDAYAEALAAAGVGVERLGEQTLPEGTPGLRLALRRLAP